MKIKSKSERRAELKDARHARRVARIRADDSKPVSVFALLKWTFQTAKIVVIAASVMAIFFAVGLVFFPDKVMYAWEIIKSIWR